MVITFTLVWLQWKILGNRQFTTISGKGYQPRRLTPHGLVRWSIFALFIIYFMLAILIRLSSMAPRT